ncbi:MAG: HAD family hydrolase [Promethearchaeota archaeon]|nr:MAG: HAD family hydrolase [Candidatus Lokiarchaeota archaeon]
MVIPIIILFDLDGVILTQKALEYTALLELKNKWYNWQNVENMRLIDFARIFEESDSDNRLIAFREAFLAYQLIIPHRFKRFIFFLRFRYSYRKYEKIYEEINTQLIPILLKFKKKQIISAIVSNTRGKRLNFYRNKFQLDKYFSVFVSRDDVPIRKPHRYPIILALKLIKERFKISKIDKNKVFYIGDLPSDIICAKNASVNSIALLSGHGTNEHLRNSEPDIILQELKDILEIGPFKKLLCN